MREGLLDGGREGMHLCIPMPQSLEVFCGMKTRSAKIRKLRIG